MIFFTLPTYHSEEDWQELPGLPERICYAALVVDEPRGGIWLLGGRDCDLKVVYKVP
jgi:hypothetical protein